MLDSKKHGRGTLILFDGSVEYYGNFVADKREGMGVQVCGPDKKVAIVGKWKNDKIDGEVLIVDLSDFKNVRKAIYKNDKKVAEVDQPGPQRALGPNGHVIEVNQNEIDEAIELVRNAQEEFEQLKLEAWPAQMRRIDAMKETSEGKRLGIYPKKQTQKPIEMEYFEVSGEEPNQNPITVDAAGIVEVELAWTFL